MDGETNNLTTKDDHHSAIEGEAFWQSQIEAYQKTALNRKAYCREQHLNYNRFQYWFYKLVRRQVPDFPKAIPVKLKNNMDQGTRRVLCSAEAPTQVPT